MPSLESNLPEPDPAGLLAARLAAIVESTDDAIVSKTLTGTIVSWNLAAERIFGYSAEEMVGCSVFRLIPPELHDQEHQILASIAQGERVAHYEATRVRKDGTQIEISLTVSPLRDAGGTIVGASSIKRDITARKRTEEALRQTAKMEAIGRLAGGLAHDFNNQLHALSGFAHFIAGDPGLSAAARQDLLEIQKTAERMASLTHQLLAFARQQVLSPETLDLNHALADAQPLLQRLIGSSIEVQLALSPGPKWIRVDRAQLVQILMNLVINARDAMPGGGRVILRSQTLEVGPGQRLDSIRRPIESGAYAELAVQDTGEGIAPEHLPRVFEPFFTTTEVGRGTGLGLSTVDGIVSQSRGHIQIESAPGGGTTVRILLPLMPEPSPTAPAESSLDPRRRAHERLLVVNDEPAVRAVIVRALRGEGYEVLEARGGREAINCLEEVGGSVDLVITDIAMPVMGGRELAKELRRRYPTVPLVWISGHPRETEFPEADAGQDHPFLQKPIPVHLLLETVAGALRRHSELR